MWIDVNLQLFGLSLLILIIAEIVSRLLELARWRDDLLLSLTVCWVVKGRERGYSRITDSATRRNSPRSVCDGLDRHVAGHSIRSRVGSGWLCDFKLRGKRCLRKAVSGWELPSDLGVIQIPEWGSSKLSRIPPTKHVLWSWQGSHFLYRCPFRFCTCEARWGKVREQILLGGIFCLCWCWKVRRSFRISLYITADPWHLMRGATSGGQLSLSVRRLFRSWCHYERRFDSQGHNGLVVTIRLPSSQLSNLFGLWDDSSRARAFSRLAMMVMNSLIRL